MFNGLVREIARVKSYQNNTLSLIARHKPSLGDSIAVNGACLTVTQVFTNGFAVELSRETRTHIATENLRDKVHIEPALRYGERIDGHLLQGHIDGVGEILRIERNENGVNFVVKIPPNLAQFMAQKGSVAIDGISLTINEVYQNSIRLTLIPLTLKESLFGSYQIGRRVNVESDLLARYTARIIKMQGFNSQNSKSNPTQAHFVAQDDEFERANLEQKGLSWQDIEKISYLY